MAKVKGQAYYLLCFLSVVMQVCSGPSWLLGLWLSPVPPPPFLALPSQAYRSGIFTRNLSRYLLS